MSSPSSGSVTKVIHIAGFSRSGSTILSRILGQIDGFVAIGEFSAFWKVLRSEDALCGCGVPFRSCPFWSAVLTQAFGDASAIDAARYGMLQARFVDEMGLVHRGMMANEKKRAAMLAEYLDVLSRVYSAIVSVSGCRVIVDATKVPRFGEVLNRSAQFDVSTLHLVRDSRAATYSWQRKKDRPDTKERGASMPTKGALKSAWGWCVLNAQTQLLGALGQRYLMLRYEDFVRAPGPSVRRVLGWLGEAGADLSFIQASSVDLTVTSHTIWGNPDRLKMGRIDIREDAEWRDKMSPTDKALASALTWPQMLGYGYFKGGR